MATSIIASLINLGIDLCYCKLQFGFIIFYQMLSKHIWDHSLLFSLNRA